MIIELDKYELRPATGAEDRWDLYEKKTRTKKNSKDTYDVFIDIAYGMPLERALQFILALQLATDTTKVSFETYLTTYIRERDKLSEMINRLLNINVEPILKKLQK